MNRRVVAMVVSWLLGAGCMMAPREGQFRCRDEGDCPSGWMCSKASGESEGRCYSSADDFSTETRSGSGDILATQSDTVDTSTGPAGTGADTGDTNTGTGGRGSDSVDTSTDAQDWTCEGAASCIFPCDTEDCDADCLEESTCTQRCIGGSCGLDCRDHATCKVRCRKGACKAENTSSGLLRVNCDFGSCEVRCPGPGGCILECDSGTCQLLDCPLEVYTCPIPSITVCATDCPSD